MSKQSDEQKKQWGVTGVAIPSGDLIGLGLGGGFFNMFIEMLILQFKNDKASLRVVKDILEALT